MSRCSFGSLWISFEEDNLPPKVTISRLQNGEIALQITDAWGLRSSNYAMRPDQFEAFDVAYSIALMQDRIEHQEQTDRMESVQ